ncbi:hypothetical protein [Paenibacillus sp. GP183]|uniref:hypothetical protein n=1 Tax=Paenibacillus sp. GP183 TaxID=1882751 RepID=UPI000895144D|nr:hypothetical protein [Paenibacillus sp. GP183]SED12638.1 hypothetical protein SAMN05443246_5822 [Paenibacillus sp. GP183]
MRSTLTPPDVEPIRVWKSLDGSVPIFDDPTLRIKMLPWRSRPETNLEVTIFRVETGQITESDVEVAVTLAKMKVLTEKQIRVLYQDKFEKAHKLASRLRFLQQIGWFDGWYMESDYNGREYVWSIGIAARNYLGFVMGMKDLPNPISLAQNIPHYLTICAVNELRIQLLQKGIIKEEDFILYPHLAPNEENPLALVKMNTPMGSVVMYVERLQQTKKPLRFMKYKLNQYADWIARVGHLPSPFPSDIPPIMLWSCGTEQAVREIVGSLNRLPEEMIHLFLIDEHMHDAKQAFFIAEKGEEAGRVTLKQFVFDFFED